MIIAVEFRDRIEYGKELGDPRKFVQAVTELNDFLAQYALDEDHILSTHVTTAGYYSPGLGDDVAIHVITLLLNVREVVARKIREARNV